MSAIRKEFTLNKFSPLLSNANGVFFNDNLTCGVSLSGGENSPITIKKAYFICGENYYYDGEYIYSANFTKLLEKTFESAPKLYAFYFGENKKIVVCGKENATVISSNSVTTIRATCVAFVNDTLFGAKGLNIGIGVVLNGEVGYPKQTVSVNKHHGNIENLLVLNGDVYAFTTTCIYKLSVGIDGATELKRLDISVSEINPSSAVTIGDKIIFFANGVFYSLVGEKVQMIASVFNHKIASVHFADCFGDKYMASVTIGGENKTFIYDNDLGETLLAKGDTVYVGAGKFYDSPNNTVLTVTENANGEYLFSFKPLNLGDHEIKRLRKIVFDGRFDSLTLSIKTQRVRAVCKTDKNSLAVNIAGKYFDVTLSSKTPFHLSAITFIYDKENRII